MLERYYTVREVSERTGEQAVRDWLDGKTPRTALADGGAGRQTRVDAGANGIS